MRPGSRCTWSRQAPIAQIFTSYGRRLPGWEPWDRCHRCCRCCGIVATPDLASSRCWRRWGTWASSNRSGIRLPGTLASAGGGAHSQSAQRLWPVAPVSRAEGQRRGPGPVLGREHRRHPATPASHLPQLSLVHPLHHQTPQVSLLPVAPRARRFDALVKVHSVSDCRHVL